ncbi:MAG: FAD-dependent oxidoreductase [Planctomycetota bacterium]
MQISRRRFLPLAAGLSISLAHGASIATAAEVANRKHVVVIGAGASGLKAARDLRQAGFRVTVLEARNRIGGRVHTDWTMGVPVEMGASWIHGIQGNPVYQLARRLGQPTLPWEYNLENVYDINNRLTNRYNPLYQRFENVVSSYAPRVLRQNSRATVQDAINLAKSRGAFENFNVSQQGLNYLAHHMIEQEFAADAAWLGANSILEGEYYRGGDVMLPGGFDQLMNWLARGLDIRYRHIVREIDYRQRRTRVRTSRGTFTADYVVVTVPVGVLKEGAIRFRPNLPRSKRNAIARMDMGVFSKTYLKFPEVFWDQNVLQFSSVSRLRGQWSIWGHQDPLHNQPVLVGFNSGTFAWYLERELSDDDVVFEAMKKLRSLFGNQIPDPVAHKMTRWSEDPFSYGAYSHLSDGGTPRHRVQLRKRVGSKLFFAGEATHSQYPSTVHGAFMSGKKAASDIMRVNSP